MKVLFRDIFEYHYIFNQKIGEHIKQELQNLPERTFHLYCHILNAHQIWNARILNMQPFEAFEIHLHTDCFKINEENYTSSLKIIDLEDLEKKISYQNSKGTIFSNKICEILYHIVNHTSHHRGQIISDFRKAGFSPIKSDYIFYKR